MPLTVTATPGAMIFVDGVRAGLAPLKGVSFIAGSYRIVAVAGDVESFGYEVTLDKAPVDVAIDLDFEGSLRPQLPLCVNGGDAEAIKLAAREGADRLLVLRVDATGWVTAMLFDVSTGTRVRDGGMKLSEARQGTGYTELATFVLTGQPARLALANRTLELEKPAPSAIPVPVPEVAPPAAVVERAPEAIQPAPSAAPRVASLVVAGAGVAAAGVGLGVYFAGSTDRTAFANAVDSSGVIDTRVLDPRSAGELEQRVATNQTLSMGLLIGGGVVAATGAVLFFALGPKDAPKPTVMLGPNGAYAGIAGSF